MNRATAGRLAAESCEPVGMLLSRRQFLWWSAALSAGAAVSLPWPAERPLGLGFIGLGRRGELALALCRGLQGIRVAALCDREPRVIRRLLAAGAAAELTTGEPMRLLHDPSVDAVVLAAAGPDQLALAGAACQARKDVLLLRPFAVDTTALRRLATLAARHSVQFHLARTSRFALGHGAARGLVAAGGAGASSAMVETRLQSPRPLAAPELLHDLLDEADFASAVLGGEVVRALAAGGSRCLPGRWMDRRMYLELDGENGVRRGLTLALTVERGPAAAKASQILVRGSRGSASLAALPVAGCDPLDLDAFLAAVRCRQPGPGLTLQRLLNLTDRVLASIPP